MKVRTISKPGATRSYHSCYSPVILQVDKSISVLVCVFRKHPRYSPINYVGSGHVNSCFPEHKKPNLTHVLCYTGLHSCGSHRAGLAQ